MNNDAKKINIASIKKNVRFEIPPYQRLYEWEEIQIETLLEDVKKAQGEGKGIYFIGNVVVSKEGERYILIDGQQRLTTLFLIGIYLASKECDDWSNFVKSEDNKLRISMPLRENEERWLSELIDETKGKGFKEDLKNSSEIHQKIADGLKTIKIWFEQNSQISIKEFSDFLYHNVCFALVKLAEKTDLNQFFVRMNNRGKQLEKHEILKSRLLSVIENKENRKKYAKIWDLCSDMDKYIFYYQNDREIIKSRAKQDDRGIESKTLKEIISSAVDRDSQGKEEDKNIFERKVESIVDFPTFLLHVAKLFAIKCRFGKCKCKLPPINKNKLLEIICVSKEDCCSDEKITFGTSERVEKFIDFMLRCRLAFDCFVIKRILDDNLLQGDDIDKRYAIGILDFDEKSKPQYRVSRFTHLNDLAILQDYLRLARSANQTYHHWLTSFLRYIVLEKNFLESIQIAEQEDCFCILKYTEDCFKFLKDFDTKLAIKQALKEQDENRLIDFVDADLMKQKQQYCLSDTCFDKWDKEDGIDFLNQGTGTPHYWFYRLEYYLMKDQKNFEERKIGEKTFGNVVSNYRFRYVDSIEHIQPQSKSEDGEWKNKGVNNFGNLALISKDFNSSLNNQDVKEKYFDIVKRIPNIQSLKMFLAYASMKDGSGDITWNPDKAEEHQKEMLEILKTSLQINVENEK